MSKAELSEINYEMQKRTNVRCAILGTDVTLKFTAEGIKREPFEKVVPHFKPLPSKLFPFY